MTIEAQAIGAIPRRIRMAVEPSHDVTASELSNCLGREVEAVPCYAMLCQAKRGNQGVFPIFHQARNRLVVRFLKGLDGLCRGVRQERGGAGVVW